MAEDKFGNRKVAVAEQTQKLISLLAGEFDTGAWALKPRDGSPRFLPLRGRGRWLELGTLRPISLLERMGLGGCRHGVHRDLSQSGRI